MKPYKHLPTFIATVTLTVFLIFSVVALAEDGQSVIRLRVKEPLGIARDAQPVVGGVPLARGAVDDASNLAITDSIGEEIPSQFQAMSRWPDGSIKWLLVDLQTDLPAGEEVMLSLVKTTNQKTTQPTLRVRESDEQIEVDTGPLRFTVKRTGFNFIDEAWIETPGDDGEIQVVKNRGLGGCRIRHLDKTEYWSRYDPQSEVVVEEQGPLRTTIHARGRHVRGDGESFCRWEVRIHAYAGKSSLRVFHTLIFDADPENDLIRDVSLHLPLSVPQVKGEKPVRTWSAMLDEDLFSTTVQTDNRSKYIALVQDRYDHAKLYNESYRKLPFGWLNVDRLDPQGRTLAHGRSDYYYSMEAGTAAPGIIDYSTRQFGVSLAVRHFREQYPNEIQITSGNDVLISHLWPEHDDMMSLSRGKQVSAYSGQEGIGSALGMAKTQEIYFHFHNGPKPDLPRLLAGLKPLRPLVDAEDMVATGAFGRIHPHDPEKFPEIEKTLEELFDWQMRHVDRNRWYGKWDFGATQISWNHRSEMWSDIGRHGWTINEVSNTYGPWIMYARTGDPKYFDWAEINTRYLLDVGTVHSGEQAGAQRRHAEKHWGGGTDSTHTYLHAPLYYYYFTGDRRAYDILRMSGEYMYQVHQNGMELKKKGGQKYASAGKRGFLNPLNSFAQLLELTGEKRFRIAAEIRISAWMDGSGHSGYGEFALEEWFSRHELSKEIEQFYLRRAGSRMKPLVLKPLPRELLSGDPKCLPLPSGLYPKDPSPRYYMRYWHGMVFRTMAQAYWMTKDEKYLRVAMEDLNDFMSKADRSDDWRYRGSLRGSNTALNLNMLHTVPFLLAALNDLSSERRAGLSRPTESAQK